MIHTLPRRPSVPNRPPGPGFSIPGQRLLAFRRDPTGLLTGLAQTYGDIVQFRFAGQTAFLLNHPDFIQQVLVTEHSNFTKGRALHRMRLVLGHGLLTSEGSDHQQARRLVQPVFHHERIADYAATMAAEAERTGATWRNGATFDVAKAMNHLTLRIVGRTLFGADLAGQEERIAAVLDDLFVLSDPVHLLLAPLLAWLPTATARRFHESKEFFDRLIYGLIDERRQSGPGQGDLLDMLLASVDEETGRPPDDQFIRDQALTLLLAGHETTANALTWCWHLLAAHPQSEARLHEEVGRVLPAGKLPGMADLGDLPYTRSVLSESLRLYPPAWVIGRSAIDDCVIGGYPVPAGSMIILSQWVTHRDPRYFAHADSFLPDRWLSDGRSERPKFAYFPFGGGPRVCIGAQFAWTEGVLLLATLARRWQLLCPADSRPVRMDPRVTLRPQGGLWMEVKERIGRLGH
ncbi:MAG: cytochrome P450 [Chloroflexi bacterium]|nr:cytochrome P450 [Chloroflexota bacterium]